VVSVSFNRRVDPFDELETVTMDEGDFLIVAVMKTGEFVSLGNLSGHVIYIGTVSGDFPTSRLADQNILDVLK